MTIPDYRPKYRPNSRFFLHGWFIVAKHSLPRHAAVRYYQSVEFFPPRKISPLAAEKTHHLQQIIDFRWPQSWLESGHNPAALGNNSSDLTVAFSLYRISEIWRVSRQTRGYRTITATPRAVTVKTPLSVKRIHPLVSPAADK